MSEENYSDKYSEESFWQKVGKFALVAGKKVIEIALTLYYCLKDPDTPKRAKATITGALGYFIWPLDAIPDLVPVVGYSDDLGALMLALAIVAAHVKAEHRRRAKDKLKEWFGEEQGDDDVEPVGPVPVGVGPGSSDSPVGRDL